jgi:hypothetical protein
MLTITEESAAYPPDGKLPDLENDEDAYGAVAGRLGARLYPDGDIPGHVWAKLVTWSGDRTPRTHPTWTDAAGAAARELSAEEARRHEATTAPRRGLDRGDADDELAARLGGVSPEVVRARKFSNCGQTAVLVLEGLEKDIPALRPLRRSTGPVTITEANHGDLRALLDHVPGRGYVSLIDCSFPAVHTFLIEVHPDRRRYLIQGYQGVYVASWWLATEDAGLVLGPLNRTDPHWQDKFDTEVNSLREVRTRFGKGEVIFQHEWSTFVTNLTAAFAGGSWATFAEQWMNLPFAPTTGERESIAHRGDAPSLQIATFDVACVSWRSICAAQVPAQVMAHVTK